MRKVHGGGDYNLADHTLVVFALLGRWCDQKTKFLDFGCGEGRLVYDLRDRGIDAYGFDIHDRVVYRHPDDRRFFGFVNNPQTDTSNALVDDKTFHIPFPDETFDVVYSTSVLEHVMDMRQTMKEISRVVKTDGFTFHVYPPKSIFIEPHMYVPFGSRFQSWWYFYFWSLLGIRNEHQYHLKSASEVADYNVTYCNTGLKYLSNGQLLGCCREFFETARLADDALNYDRKSMLLRRARIMFGEHPWRGLSRSQKLSGLYTSKTPEIPMDFVSRALRAWRS